MTLPPAARPHRLVLLFTALTVVMTLPSGAAAASPKTVTGIAVTGSPRGASAIADGRATTGWKVATSTSGSTAKLDLRRSWDLRRLSIAWAGAGSASYSIEVSEDGRRWTKAFAGTRLARARETKHDQLVQRGRFLRLHVRASGSVSINEVRVDGTPAPSSPNLALESNATSSGGSHVERAVDGSVDTRFVSNKARDPWIQVDLGDVIAVKRIQLKWGLKPSRRWTLSTSSDGVAWQTKFAATNGRGGTNNLDISADAQFVRLTASGSEALDVRELEVFDQSAAADDGSDDGDGDGDEEGGGGRTPTGGGDGGSGTETTPDPTTSPDTTAPTAPGGTLAVPSSSDSVLVTWIAATDDVGVTGYQLRRWGAVIATLPAGTTSFQDTGLIAGTAYQYAVQALDAAGNVSANSNTASVTIPVPDTTAPTAPASATATTLSESSIRVNWTASTDAVGVTQYRIYRGATQIGTVSGSTLAFTETGLAPSTAYSYRVRAIDAAGNTSSESSAASATTNASADVTAPTAPGTPTATVLSHTSIRVNWTASTDAVGVTEYRIFRGATQVGTVSGATLSYTDTGLTPTTAYSYHVRARDIAGNESADSTDATATTSAAPDVTAPTAPGSAAATVLSHTSIRIDWAASTDAVGVTEYRIFRGVTQIGTVSGSTLTYTDTGLTPSTVYTYRVRARDAAGNTSVDSATLSPTTNAAPDVTSPTVPGSPSATVLSSTSIRVNWTASTDAVGVTEYRVLRGGTQVGTVSGGTLTWTDTGLTPSTAYSYRVRAVDAAGNVSSDFVAANATTSAPPDTTAPTAPGSPSASALSSTSILVSWTASTDAVGVTEYRVLRGGTQIATVSGATLSYTNTGLTPSTAYSYVVRAVDAAGNISSDSVPANATTPAPPDVTAPTAPGSPSATVLSSTSIRINWTASTDAVGVTGYRILRGGTQIGTVGGATLTYTDTGLAASTAYSYVVRAVDAAGNVSTDSSPANATTSAAPDTTAPTAPGSPTATAQSSTSVRVTWTASSDAVGVTGYRIFRDGTQVGTVGGATLTFTDTGLTPSTAYSYRVRAADAAGNVSTDSAAANATTDPPSADVTAPSVPGSVTAVQNGDFGADIDWAASTDAVGVTSYVVRRDGAQVATVTAPTSAWTDGGLDPDRAYSYSVSARDAAGNESAASAAATMSTPNPAGANLPIRYDLASITGTKYFVSTTGSNSNAGTSEAAPLLTLQAAVSKVGAGQNATIIVRGGTYRDATHIDGFSKTLRIRAYPGEIPTFNGAMEIDGGWTSEASLAWHVYTAQPVTDGAGILFTNGQNLTGDFIGRNPDQAWIGSTQLRQVSLKANVVDGTFWVDSSSSPNRIYMTAVDAAKSDLEASNLDWFLDLGGASSTIDGIRITRYSNSANDYGVLRITYGASNAVVQNTEITHSAFNAMTVSGNFAGAGNVLVHPVIKDITISDSNWMGMSVAFADDSVVDRALITRSNLFDEFTYSPQSGAIKTSRLRRMDITNSEVLDNHSHGIWFDQSNIDMDVVGNRIVDNSGNGVFFEISDDMLLANNYIRNYAGDAAAVKIAGSSGVKMVNNTLIGGADVVGIYTDSRSMPGCAIPGQPLCAGSYSSERDAYRPLPATLDWMPRIDMMLNNIIMNPTGQSYCGRPTAVCVTTTNSTATAPIESIFHQAEPGRGIPQTVVNGNVFSNTTNGTSLLVPGSGNMTAIAQWVTKLGTAPINLAGQESGGKSGASWVNTDGSPTSALSAVHSEAAAIPTDAAVNEYIPAGTRHYGVLDG